MILSPILAIGVAIAATSVSTLPPAPGPLVRWDGEEEVDLYSAVIPATSCAHRIADTGDLGVISACSPMEAARSGFAIYDPVEGQVYTIDSSAIYQFELEHGVGGSIDIYGLVKGARDGTPVIQPEEYSISPKPKPDAFKGCL